MAEARRVNETQDDVLRYVGGSISPEMDCVMSLQRLRIMI